MGGRRFVIGYQNRTLEGKHLKLTTALEHRRGHLSSSLGVRAHRFKQLRQCRAVHRPLCGLSGCVLHVMEEFAHSSPRPVALAACTELPKSRTRFSSAFFFRFRSLPPSSPEAAAPASS